MKNKEFILNNQGGLHARPCSQLVSLASKFTSKIVVTLNGKEVNAKSVLGLMTIGSKEGDILQVTTEGPDELEAMEKLIEFFANL